eukprot:scaffold42690_cov60-Phaeocystis_antarctica.AAC.5
MAEGGTAKMRAMRARGRDSGGVATAEIKDKVSSMMKEGKEGAQDSAGGAGAAKKKKKPKRKKAAADKDEV